MWDFFKPFFWFKNPQNLISTFLHLATYIYIYMVVPWSTEAILLKTLSNMGTEDLKS